MTYFSRVQIDQNPVSNSVEIEGFKSEVFPSDPPFIGPLETNLFAAYPSSDSLDNAIKALPGFSEIAGEFADRPYQSFLRALEELSNFLTTPMS